MALLVAFLHQGQPIDVDNMLKPTLDGRSSRQLDLSADHARRLRGVLAPYVRAARQVSGPSVVAHGPDMTAV